MMFWAAAVVMFAVGCNDDEGGIDAPVNEEVAVAKVEIVPATLELTAGQTATLEVRIQPVNATDKAVVWSSENKSVATVVDGVVTAQAAGETLVTAKAHNGITASCRITVQDSSVPVSEIRIEPETLSLKVGESYSLQVEVLPANATDKRVAWSVEPAGIVSMSGNTVVAESAGEAVITATSGDGKVAASCFVTVAANTPDNPNNPDEYDEVILNTLTKGEMDFYGQVYGTELGSDYMNWTIYLSTDDFDFDLFDVSGPMMVFDLNTPASAGRELVAGTYTVMEYDNPRFDPYTLVYGYTDDEGYMMGTWYMDDFSYPDICYGATAGTVTVTRDGDNYNIVFDLTDEDYGGHVTGSYSGPLGFYDASGDYMSLGCATAEARPAVRAKHPTIGLSRGVLRARADR